MTEIKIPTVGRIVHYFPNGSTDVNAAANGATVLPALVIQPFGTAINLHVHAMNPDCSVLLRYSVSHKSSIGVDEAGKTQTGQAYWDWPARD